MKNLKYLLFSLFLILSFNVNVKALQPNETVGIKGKINDIGNYNYGGANQNWVNLASGSSVGIKVEVLHALATYPIDDRIKGVSYYVMLIICTTDTAFSFGTNDANFSSNLAYKGYVYNNPNQTCTLNGYPGIRLSSVHEYFVKDTQYRAEDGAYIANGYFTFWKGGYTTYGTYYNIESINIWRSTNRNYDSIKVGDSINANIISSDNTNKSILQRIIDLPVNLWNLIQTGFNWIVDGLEDVVDFIVGLPSGIWNAIKTGFTWIKDGVTNLLNFFNDDDDVDVNGLSSIGLLPAGAVDSILNLPFTFLDNLNTNLNNQCQAVNIPLPYVDKNLPLPCVNTVFTQISGLSVFISGLSVILASFILFKYLINLYKWVDKTLSLKDNNHLDNWGGL